MGNMQKPHVGGLKQGDTQREVDAHEEILDIVGEHDGHRDADRVRDLSEHPVAVQEKNGSQGQGQATKSESWAVAVEPAECHAGEDQRRPYRAKADVEDTHAIPPGRCRWEVVDCEIFHPVEDSSKEKVPLSDEETDNEQGMANGSLQQ